MHSQVTALRAVAVSLTALGALAAPAVAFPDTPLEGFELVTGLPYPAESSLRTLSNGEMVTFDGTDVVLWNADGTQKQLLTSFSPSIYGGVFEVDPSETYVLVGKTGEVDDRTFSAFGDLYQVDLAAGGQVLIADLVFNFDAVFEDADNVLVSAATGGFSTGNDIYRVHVPTRTATQLAHVDGPSGPIELDGNGNLFYATQSDFFPAPAGSIDVLLFPGGLLTGAPVLDENSAIPFSTGFDGAAELVWDEESSILYLVENTTDPVTFTSSRNRIYRVGLDQASSSILVEGPTGNSIGNVELELSGTPALFRPFQPAQGDLIRYTSSNAFTYPPTPTVDRVEIIPERPEMVLQGPGATGPGLLDVTIEGGPSDGSWMLLIGAQATYDPVETAFLLANHPPIFTGIPSTGLVFVPTVLPLDGDGEGGFSLFQDGSLNGLLALQAICFDADNNTVGTSTAALL